MLKFLMIIFSLSLFTSEGSARAVKLGSKTNQRSSLVVPGQTGAVSVGISCFDNAIDILSTDDILIFPRAENRPFRNLIQFLWQNRNLRHPGPIIYPQSANIVHTS